MAQRMSTTDASKTSDSFTPTADSIFQFASGNDQAVIDIETRLHADAPWAVVDTMHATSRKIVRVAQLPTVRFTLRNGQGTSTVWDAE